MVNVIYCAGAGELPELRYQHMSPIEASLHMDFSYGCNKYDAQFGDCTTLIVDLLPASTFAYQCLGYTGLSDETLPESKYFPGYVIVSIETAYAYSGNILEKRSIIR